ncbi:MAG: radical SAM protein [Deltaproteobacteria bacterium]|nr:radical SAM protein [Deltaproteobacteria bacterium]
MIEHEPINRERASHEKRCWVRLTRLCNNHCLFFLDTSVEGVRIRDTETIRREISDGHKEGSKRLILSGGEPTIHPEYLDLLTYGRQTGYRWIQTITNGRMFSYTKFAQNAVKAGLNETTFSMHGNQAEIHDRLVGVDGAFEQSLHGMDNLMRLGIVVNVDVVMNALNISQLPEILEVFIQKGISEFDLLWMVPFGSAWKNREELFLQPTTALPYLQQAIELARQANVVVWTNRLPAKMLEGNEDLIQDPYKLHDEVRGRMPEFRALLKDQTPLECNQADRCGYCPMEGYCRALERLIIAPGRSCELVRVTASDPQVLDELVSSSSKDIEVILNRESAAWLLDRKSIIEKEPSRFLFSLQGFLTLSEVDKFGVNPIKALKPLEGQPVRLINIAPCTLSGAKLILEDIVVGPDALPNHQGNLSGFTDHFIRNEHRVFSLRCEECQERKNCPGQPVNLVRKYGFAALCRPVNN